MKQGERQRGVGEAAAMSGRQDQSGGAAMSDAGAPRLSRRMALRAGLGAAGLAAGGGARRVAASAPRTASPTATPIAVPLPSPPPLAMSADVAVFPLPGSRTASPATELSFRGVAVAALGGMTVVGTQSGGHSGVLVAHADGQGASYLPDVPFQTDEVVTIHSDLQGVTGSASSFSFITANPVPAPKTAVSRDIAHPKHVAHFHSRPDLQPPPITVKTAAHDTAPGSVVLGARLPDGANGPMLVDNRGELIWFEPQGVDVLSNGDVRVQRYRGEPVLTWWEGVSADGHGLGHYVLRDASYQQIAMLHVGNGYAGGDGHEVLVSPQDTLLVTVFNPVQWDLSAVGGPVEGVAMDGIIQELEIPSGRVLFEWHSLDHVGLDESLLTPSHDAASVFDYFHLNSIAVDHDGHLIISARHTSAIYKVHRQTGEVLWRLNGKRSDFAMGLGTVTRYQHDARVLPSGDLTVFDNATAGGQGPLPPSRGIVVRLDFERMTASLVRQYIHPERLTTPAQGNMQALPNGNVFIGWGDLPVCSEFAADGTLLFDARLPSGDYSYRAYRFPWTGHPVEAPAIVIEPAEQGELIVYVSWNGATEVARWQVLAGSDPNQLRPAGAAARTGFETAITVQTTAPYLAVEAQDDTGKALGRSAVTKTGM